MAENRKVVEPHGCIVCGRVYEILVVYTPAGELLDCTPLTPGGRVIPDARRPLVACDRHPESQVQAALEHHYPGAAQDEDEEKD
jgi:hypothetical protein